MKYRIDNIVIVDSNDDRSHCLKDYGQFYVEKENIVIFDESISGVRKKIMEHIKELVKNDKQVMFVFNFPALKDPDIVFSVYDAVRETNHKIRSVLMSCDAGKRSRKFYKKNRLETFPEEPFFYSCKITGARALGEKVPALFKDVVPLWGRRE